MSVSRSLAILLVFGAAALNACGGGGGASPTQPPVLTPAPTPAPAATPTPAATPCPDGTCGNSNPVVRTQLNLYLMFNANRDPVPAPDPEKQVVKDPIPVGYTVRLDVSGKDADGHETDGKGQIQWFYSDPSMVQVDERSPWTHDFKILKAGTWSVYVIFDGVGSNDLNFTFVD